jgi:hypothetical protein
MDVKSTTVTGHKEGHYVMMIGSVHQEEITTVKVYAANIKAPKYRKQTLIEGRH